MFYRVSAPALGDPIFNSKAPPHGPAVAFQINAMCMVLALLLPFCQRAMATLPQGWTDLDLGTVGQPGSASVSNSTWTISGSGTDVCSFDQFHFVYTQVNGDFILLAKLETVLNVPGSQAGIMLRDNTTSGAIEAALLAVANGGITFQWRSTPGLGCSYQNAIGVQGLVLPVWLKVARSGGNFSGYYSTNGTDFYQAGVSQTIPMSQAPLAGLAVCAQNNSALATATFSGVSAPPRVFGVYREWWSNLDPSVGNSLAALTNSAYNINWPDNPDTNFATLLEGFETATNTGLSYYGQRLRTFVVPPITGNYLFWISSANTSQLFLSSDETASRKASIAWVNTATGPHEWTKETNQQSAPMLLQAGHRYYLEALMQHSTGNDNLAVRWQLPNGTNEEPITAISSAGTKLVPCTGLDLFPGIYSQPTNITVSDGLDAPFSVLVTNQSAVTYQWQVNGGNIAGADGNSPVFVVSNANPILNSNQIYTCVVSSLSGSVTSAPAVLTVIPDTTAPRLSRALYLNQTNVQVIFSEPVSFATATKAGNYVFTNGLPITNASLGADNLTVTLTTAPLVSGSNYVLVISGIQDRATTPNTIAPNTSVAVFAGPYAPLDIGNPVPSGSITGDAGGFNVSGAGRDIGGASDQLEFAYQTISGDFDTRVRLKSFTQTDPFSKAGLMAREDLNPNSRFAAVLATPSINGSFFESRAATGVVATVAGRAPVNYPEHWLRLQRTGTQLAGYASFDGVTWQQLGTVSLTSSGPLYFGMAVCSHLSGQTAVAQFRELSPATNATLGALAVPNEPLGPCSRKTPIVISEIMYKPAPRADTNNLEFIEIYNSNPWFHDISGYRLVGDNLQYTFPAATIIPGGAFLVIAASPASISQVYGIANVLGPYTGSLKKSGTLQLLDEVGSVLLSVPYSNVAPWPVAADGTGHSLVLANPTYGEADPRAWAISDAVGGSPGQIDGYRPSPLRDVVINEFLAHTDPPLYDYIELYNHANSPVDISGCILTDDPNTNKFVIPSGISIPGRGFVVYSETNMNFRLSAAGETIYFKNPDQSRVLDAVQFGAQENGVATGRWPDGANEFYRLNALTPGTPNTTLRASDIVINELMYDPITRDDDDQYVELYNRSSSTVNLGGWQLSDAVSFNFPSNTVLAADAYLVVARNAARLRTNYPNLNQLNCLGNYGGKLSHNGDHVALTMPDTIVQTNSQGIVSTNLIHIVVNDVTYGTGGRWGQWTAGGGSSLELVDPHSNNRLAANWADSDETGKSAWVNMETTGVLDNGANYDPSIDYAQIGLLDVGECLVDNVEVRSGTSGANLVANPDFETGALTGWFLQGDHFRSSLQSPGYASSYCLHLRCSDRIWTGINSCEMALTANSLGGGQTATLRFKARWLHGWPEVLLRLNGNWLETTGTLPVPSNLGTPGARNSRFAANVGPAIYSVTHNPPIPAANQAVIVTARVHDPDGVQNLTLNYRIDPGTAYAQVPMVDDGTVGDAIAGDGIFSATLPGQPATTIAAFYISAQDPKQASTRFPALLNNNAPAPECVVRFGDANPNTSFGVYHLWITGTNVNRWVQLADLSNESHDCTMVNGTRVIYNAQARFSGSPYHQDFNTPNGALCHYKWIFPDDDKFLGATSFNKLHQPGNGAGDDASIQREQTAHMFLRALRVPWLNRRYVAVYVNGNRRGTLMEDAQTPDADVVKEYFPNDKDGWLYKMQPWFEFAPTPSGSRIGFNNVSWCNLMPYTTTAGAKKTARYRYNFLVRRTPTSANDFTNILSLVDAASSFGKPNYVAHMERLADMENWMRVFAANHAAGNWDSFGSPNSQNLYGYMGAQGTRYSLMMWDFNIVLGNSGSWGPGQNLFTFNGQDPNTINIFNEPTFRRMYWRALQELVNGPLDVSKSGPLLDAKYNTFVANGLSVENPSTGIKPWLTQARNSIASQIAAVDSVFSVNPSVVLSNNLAFVTGTAPFQVKTIWINGAEWPLSWTGLSSWTVAVPLHTGVNALNVMGVDIHGQPVAGASSSLSVTYSPSIPSPAGLVVINEIMYNPAAPNAQFVELYNASTNTAFDMSGWQLKGLSYTFPTGSVIAPTGFLCLGANAPGFAAAYGATTPLFDVFNGTLQSDGETLSLIQPAGSDPLVTKVRYSGTLPWPTNANGTASSLQLIDPNQDNWRAGNWAAMSSNSPAPGPQWQYVTVTGAATKPILLVGMHGTAGDVYVDDLKLVHGSVPEVGVNLIQNGDFETALTGPWTVSANMASSVISTSTKHSGAASLHVIASSPGDTISQAIWENTGSIITNDTYTLSYWYPPSLNGSQLLIRLSGSSPASGQVYSLQNIQPPTLSSALSTPGATNSVLATLPVFPPLWLNELQADNITGITNRAGQHAPWLELYNPSSKAVSLAGLFLAKDYASLTAWQFPTAAAINAGEFKIIFADGQTNLSTLNELHTSFLLPSGSGALALSRLYNGQPQVLDYVDYTNLTPNYSFGSLPDGQSFDRQEFFYATPGALNNATNPPSFVPYNIAGRVYTQDFDSLPAPGATSVNTANPVTINGITYSLGNPFDFAFPALPSGGTGGLGLEAMRGWYGLGALASKFGATDGDQTTGGEISFGLPDSSDRALGLLATSSTGPTAFGVKFINQTLNTLNYINLEYTGEVWRQSDLPKTLKFFVSIDPTAAAQFSTNATGYVPSLDVRFPTVATDVGGVPVDGSAQVNQLGLEVINQAIPDWAPGAALWLGWEMTDATGRAQGLAIDNLSFSATSQPTGIPVPLTIEPSGTNIIISWLGTPGQTYQIEFKNDLNAALWTPLSNPVTGTGAPLVFTNDITGSPQRFFRLTILP